MTRTLILIATLLTALAQTADAKDTPWVSCAIKSCKISQKNCWLKSGTAVCDKDQMECGEAEFEEFIEVRRSRGKLIEIVSPRQRGWANTRMLMMQAPDCKLFD